MGANAEKMVQEAKENQVAELDFSHKKIPEVRRVAKAKRRTLFFLIFFGWCAFFSSASRCCWRHQDAHQAQRQQQ
jgi:hypothetical protein